MRERQRESERGERETKRVREEREKGGRELLNNKYKEFNGVKGRERERRVIDSKR